jgi:DNA-binding beta-propeller fold protein YncE
MSKHRVLLSGIVAVFLAAAPSEAQTLAQALDQESWTFSTLAESPWVGQGGVNHDGVDAAQAGSTNGTGSWLETTRSLASAGTIEFWWKVSGGRSIVFVVDGAAVAEKTGPSDWTKFSWVVLAGAHTFRWECGDPGATGDTGWVDQLAFTPSGTTYRTLSIAVLNEGGLGVSMTVAPPDANARAEGLTPLTLLFADGTSVEIEAAFSVNQGGQQTGFGGWSGCDSGVDRKCTVAMNSDRAVTAAYLPGPALLWHDRIGGAAIENDTGGGIALGPDGSVWAAGTVYDRGGRVGGVANAWLGRYSAGGTRLWETKFPGFGNDVAVATDGSVYLTGTMSRKLFVRKFSPEGEVLWTRTRNGEGKGVAVSPDGGSVYVTGAASGDVLTQKYSSAGDLVWTRTYNGSANRADEGRRVKVDANGGVFVVGAVRRSGKGQSAWIRKYSSAGAVLWTSAEDGTGAADDWASGLTLSGDRLYIAGSKMLAVAGQDALHRHHWMAAYSADGGKIWSFERSCDPTGPWNFETISVAASPLGTVDFAGREYFGRGEMSIIYFRLRQDGSPVDSTTESFYFPQLDQGKIVGLVAGEDALYMVGSGFSNNLSAAYAKFDIFVGKIDAKPPSAP